MMLKQMLFLSTIICAAIMTKSSPSMSAAAKTLRVGHIPLTASLPVYAAYESGCFEQEGLTVELIMYGSSNEVAEAGAAGRIDVVGAAATNAMLDVATEQNKTVQAVLFTQYVKRPELQSTDFLVAQPEIKTPSELKGRKVAFFPGSVSRVLAKLTLPKYGLTIDDIKLIEMSPAKWGAALANREVDAAHLLEPAASKILAESTYTVLIDGYWGEVQGKVPVAAAWFVTGSLSKNDEAKFYRAFACGLKAIEEEPNFARRALVKHTGMDTTLAPKVRLLDYAMASDDSAAESAISFVKLLQTNEATMFTGKAGTLIYRP